MNKHLQTILNSIQQSMHLSIDEKNVLLKAVKDADKEMEIAVFKLDRTEKVKRTTAILLEETIEELEQKRKAVEAQNKELEIEAALERVRTVAMSMRTPTDLLDICEILYTEFQLLGFNELRNAMINIYEDDKIYFLNYDYTPGPGKTVTHITYNFHPLINKQVNETKNAGDAFIEFSFARQELKDFRELRKNNGEQDDPKLDDCSSLHYYFYSFGTGSIGISTYNAVTDEKKNVLKRFRNVFDLAYKRYVDIARAEAQAKESQIQLALERVRARTMAMQRSDELPDAVNILFQQMQTLGMPAWSAGYCIWDDDHQAITLWMSSAGIIQKPFRAPVTDDPSFIHFYEAWKRGETFYVEEIGGDAIVSHYQYMLQLPVVGEMLKQFMADGGLLPTFQIFHLAFFSQGFLLFITYEPVTESHDIFRRFGNVFEQTYTRFLDLQKAEAQARESQIQLALERVRARTMAMQKSDELSEAVYILFQQFRELGENPDQATIGVINEDEKVIEYWVTMYGNPINKVFKFSLDEPNVTGKIYTAWKENKKSLVIDLSGNSLSEFMTYRAGKGGAAINPDEKRRIINVAFFSKGLLNVQSNEERSEESIKLLERFASVFEQTYTRFLDLQKAEAQARESQIEASLERVRSRSMGMQKSEELKEVIQVVYEQFVHLNINVEHTGFIMDYKERDDMHIWLADKHAVPFQVSIPYFDCAHWNSFNEAKEKGIDFFVNHLSFEEKNKFYHDLFELFPGVPEETLEYYFSCPGLAISTVLLENVGLYIENFSGIPYADEENTTLMRFGKVFQQTYTRFLDLQKAEAQAREAQIEAALERVRSRTMAMQRSDELTDAAALLFLQIKELGIHQWGNEFQLWDKDMKAVTSWTGNQGGNVSLFKIPATEDPIMINIVNAAKNGETLYVEAMDGEALESHYKYMTSLPGLKEVFKKLAKDGFTPPKFQVFHAAYFSSGYILFITQEPVPEAHDIFKRFAKVFEQTYTRFLDLQKAEAQARESQIEAALERVRSRTMGMQRSDELQGAALLLFQQAETLGVKAFACGFNIWDDDRKFATAWMGSVQGLQNPFKTDSSKDIYLPIYEAAQRGEAFFVREQGGEELKVHYDYLATIPIFRDIFMVNLAKAGFAIPSFQIIHCAFFAQGYLMFISYEPCPEAYDIFKRFAKVFEQTYTRFLDLQRAEAQAKEATKQASLDRVRGQIASMRSTEDLQRITPLIWHELTSLDVPFIRCGVLIIDETKAEAHIYLSSPDGHSLAAMNLPIQSNTLTANSVEYWRKGMVYTEHWDKEAFSKWMQSMIELGQVKNPETYQGAATPPESLQLHFVPFTQGMLYVGNTALLTNEEIDLVKSLAEAFSIAYARYEDFTKLEKAKQSIEVTLTELKATQTQLIQSEKMASLGELTAGIAHEIQNPLNFVNNFSEVSRELLDEMKTELDNGNADDAKEIANDVIQNLEKINHHGKRADAIVKGMLQHSRSSIGVKEPTNINALADEYLRLAYHGLRAKDKSFNATMKTDFDETIGAINIIPQDIGRVILNLITNAFYVVDEKKKQIGDGYEPTVSVSTKKGGDKIFVSVKDNGNGIPQKVVDKIFQPFFTTKPTGQGTGLGLSLAYDIVKAHGGEIKAETKEDEGSEFIIQLPINS